MILTGSVQSAVALAERGDFTSAIEMLGDHWLGVGVEPERRGGADSEYALLLLACGILGVELGRFRLAPAQHAAKDMLSKAARLFGTDPNEQDARFWLGVAYVRCGENNEALSLAESILEQQTADSRTVFRAARLKGLALLNLGDLTEAEATFCSVAVLADGLPALCRGRFLLSRGMLYRQTKRYEMALADYDSATLAFVEAHSVRYQAAAENNRAGVYMEQGRFAEARRAAQSAIALFRELRDQAHEAKAWDQLAQVFGREGYYELMEAAAREAVSLLSPGDHDGWLAEALTTHGIACARVGISRAREQLERAIAICNRQGDLRQADLALSAMWRTMVDGKRVLTGLQHSVSPLEKLVYERVLEKHDGHVKPAADELGITHQAFQRRLSNHFPELLTKRRAPRARKFFRKPAAQK